MTLSDDYAKHLLATIPFIKEIETLQKSPEGGEHHVWAVNDAYILRIPATSDMNTSFGREKDLHQLLSQHIALMPKVLNSGEYKSRQYAIYEKVKGTSIEANPKGVNDTTESDLAALLRNLRQVSTEQVSGLGYPNEEENILSEMREQTMSAWKRLLSRNQLQNVADIDDLLKLPPDAPHPSTVTHADLKGEHIFIDSHGHATGVIDWSDCQVGHPSTDIGGLAISIGASAARRAARLAGYSENIIRRGVFQARCSLITLLDEVLNEDDDSPEWLVRLQVQRALEEE